MEKQISVLLVFVSIFTFISFGCGNKNVVQNDEVQIVKKEQPKINCPAGTVYIVDDSSVENTVIHLCINEFGQADGQVLGYYADTGKLGASLWFKNGKSVGKWVRWDNQGNVASIEHYNSVGDIRHGYTIFWEYYDSQNNVKCNIYAFSKGAIDVVSFEYINEKFSKIIVYVGPDTPPDEYKRSEMKKRDIEMLDKFYQEDIVGKELVDLPTP